MKRGKSAKTFAKPIGEAAWTWNARYQCRDAVRRSVARFAVTPRHRPRNTIGERSALDPGVRGIARLGALLHCRLDLCKRGITATRGAEPTTPHITACRIAVFFMSRFQFFGSGRFIQRLAICKCTPILAPSLSVNAEAFTRERAALQRALYDKLSHSFAVSASEAQTVQPVTVQVFNSGSDNPAVVARSGAWCTLARLPRAARLPLPETAISALARSWRA